MDHVRKGLHMMIPFGIIYILPHGMQLDAEGTGDAPILWLTENGSEQFFIFFLYVISWNSWFAHGHQILMEKCKS